MLSYCFNSLAGDGVDDEFAEEEDIKTTKNVKNKTTLLSPFNEKDIQSFLNLSDYNYWSAFIKLDKSKFDLYFKFCFNYVLI